MRELTSQNYAIIGQFVAKANQFELFVNLSIEMMIEYSKVLNTENKNDITDFIDKIQDLSVRERILFIITLLSFNKEHSRKAEYLVSYFNKLYKNYNKNLRPYRDFVAHNPYVEDHLGENGKIMNSRRYKNSKLEDLPISSISQLNSDLVKVLEEFNLIVSEIQTLYPAEITRKIT